MAKKMFLNGDRAIPPAQTLSVSREEIATTSGNNRLSEQSHITIFDETSKSFPKFNATGRSLLLIVILQLNSKTPLPIRRNALLL